MRKPHALLLLLLVTFSSCDSKSNSDDNGGNDDNTKIIGISGTVLNFTKATDASFEDGDQVGLFLTKTSTDVSVMLNGKFTYGSNGFTPEKEQNWYTEDETSRVFGYYPYKSSFTEDFPTGKLKLDVNANQSTHASYTVSDFMIGSVDLVRPSNDKINILFKHLLTKVVVNVNNQTEGDITELTISNIIGGFEYDFIDLSLTGNAITVTPLEFNSPNPGFTSSFAAIIPPQRAQPNIDITIDDEAYYIVEDVDETLISGEQLSINVNIAPDPMNPSEFIFTITTEITDWQNDDDLIFDFVGALNK